MNAEALARTRYEEDTREHSMRVLRDDGLYRHVRFSAPKTVMYRFDLVTWPGYLAIVGDVEDHLFARLPDMFQFFESAVHHRTRTGKPHINPDYWSEKLQGPNAGRSTQVYSRALYETQVLEWLEEHADSSDPGVLKAAVQEQLLDCPPHDVREAMERLHRFEYAGLRIYEPYDWRLTEFSGHFLWCCWAIVDGIRQYREAT